MNFENISKNGKGARSIEDMNRKEAEEINFDLFLEDLPEENLWREFSGRKYVTSDVMFSNFNRLGEREVLGRVEELVKGNNYYVAQELIGCLENTVQKANYKTQHDGYEYIILNTPSEKRSEKEKLMVEQIKLRAENLSLIKDKLVEISEDENLNYVMKLRVLNFLDNFEKGPDFGKNNWLPDKISKDKCAVVLGEEMVLSNNDQEPALVDFIKEKEAENKNSIARIAETIGSNFADQLATRHKKDLVGGNKPTDFQEIKKKFPDSILLQDYIESQAVLLDNNVNKEEYYRDFLFLSSPLTRNLLKKELHVRLEEVPVKTQFFLLNFLKNKNNKGVESVKKFCANFGEEGLDSFLSLEMGAELGDKILNIGDNLDPSTAKKVFAKVSELTSLIEKNDDELRDTFGVAEPFDCRELRLELLKKTTKIIQNFSDSIDRAGASNNKIDVLLLELERTKGELIILTTILKKAKIEGQDIKFNLIKDINLEINKPGEEISDSDKQQIIDIARANWQEQNPAITETVIKGLQDSLQNTKNQKCYTLKYKNEVIGFIRFEPTIDNKLYVGSLNIVKDLRGLNVGNNLMDASIAREAEINVLAATASPRISAGCNYIDKLGFVATGIISNYHQTGEPLFTIELNKARNSQFVYKKDDIKLEQIKRRVQDYNNIDRLLGRETIILRFDIDKEFDQYQKVLNKLLTKMNDVGYPIDSQSGKDKYIVTRYFPDQEQSEKGNVRYLVFEKINFVGERKLESSPKVLKKELV